MYIELVHVRVLENLGFGHLKKMEISVINNFIALTGKVSIGSILNPLVGNFSEDTRKR